TYYYQDGGMGACGKYLTNNDLICGIEGIRARYTDSLCGRQVQITNTVNGNTVTVTIADEWSPCSHIGTEVLGEPAAFLPLGLGRP
ncbi:hypothetical protein EV363DRAFT_1162763, partial [Boletus edulis]